MWAAKQIFIGVVSVFECFLAWTTHIFYLHFRLFSPPLGNLHTTPLVYIPIESHKRQGWGPFWIGNTTMVYP